MAGLAGHRRELAKTNIVENGTLRYPGTRIDPWASKDTAPMADAMVPTPNAPNVSLRAPPSCIPQKDRSRQAHTAVGSGARHE